MGTYQKKMTKLLVIFFTLGICMNETTFASSNISHEERGPTFEAARELLERKIIKRGDLPYVSVSRQIDLLNELSLFPCGRFLITTGGLNGYWTHYAVTHPNQKSLRPSLHPLEAFILEKAPVALATQQRFVLFKEQIQKHIQEGCHFASIPSGMMTELLDLDYSSIKQFTLTGSDLDPEALVFAKSYAEEKGLGDHARFLEENAWDIESKEEYDLIASNGLTIYEPNDIKVIEFYRKFYEALKEKGVLITSFLSIPPIPGPLVAGRQTEWDLSQINQEDAFLQKIIFADILDSKWQSFRSEENVRVQLQKAGFHDIEIYYDRAHIFPTVVAKK